MNSSFLKKSLLGLMVMGLLSLNFINPNTASDDVVGVANPLSEAVSLEVESTMPSYAATPTIVVAIVVFALLHNSAATTGKTNVDLFHGSSSVDPTKLGLSKLD